MAQLEQAMVRATEVHFEEVGLLVDNVEYGMFLNGWCDAETDGDDGFVITAITVESEREDGFWDIPCDHPVFKMLSATLYRRYSDVILDHVYPNGAPSFDPVREYGTLWGSP